MINEKDILFKQASELLSLRERSIQNIGSSSSAFFTFLGLVLTALALILKPDSNGNIVIQPLQQIILIFTGVIVFSFGIFTRRNIWSSYTNQIFYTRMLNMTRGYLIEGLNLEHRILLPTNWEELKYDTKGFLDLKFSKNDIVNLLKWSNTLIIVLVIFGACSFLLKPIGDTDLKLIHQLSIVISLVVGGFTFNKQDCYDLETKEKAEKKWDNFIASL